MVSTAWEFSQIRLIAALIITVVVEIEKHMLATAHINPHREKVKRSLSVLHSHSTLLSTALSHREAGLYASQINT